MQDQVNALHKREIKSVLFNSESTEEEKEQFCVDALMPSEATNKYMKYLEAGKIDILFDKAVDPATRTYATGQMWLA